MSKRSSIANPYLTKAVFLAGGQSALACALNYHMPWLERPVTQAHVWKWLKGMKGPTPPGEYVIPIVIVVDGQVTPHDLRPDLYPDAEWMPEEVRQKVVAV